MAPELREQLQANLGNAYSVERELGRGGMALVFLAQDLKHHRPVAIKVLRPELAAVLGAERFLREIELAAKLTHPHIVPVHDSGEAKGFLYYVMPFVEGESLRERLSREKQLPIEDALRIAREVADALSYAHSHGVVHRDIKPENILLEAGHAVVADFGIARAITAAGREKLTETGIAVGTPAYMSPEQAAGGRVLDGRSDLYSLACVLYEMLAGEPPFTGPTVESVVHQHLTAEAPNVAVIRAAVPQWVATALSRSLAKTPADRFNSLAQFADALGTREFAAVGAEAQHRPPSPRSWRHGALIALALAVAAAAALLWRGRGPPEARAFPPTAIAVLPLQNLSAAGPHAYFAGGLHEELLTQLAKVAALKVISRTSVMGYAGTTKPLREIAQELGVGSVVEGSVQVEGSRLRVNVQLIGAATDEHLWAERYDRTLNDAFAIQSDVAQRIVEAVGVALTRVERQGLSAAPTANAEAYRLYLQGEEYRHRTGLLGVDQEAAERLYERALALDPAFALAHAAVSLVDGWLYWLRYDPLPSRAAKQWAEARAALRLAPDLWEAHEAMAMAHYWGRRDYQRALTELTAALQGAPSSAELWQYIGAVQRRLGHWEEALAAFERATALDPRAANLFRDLGGDTYRFLHRYPEAARAYQHALGLAPDFYDVNIARGFLYVAWHGELDTLRAALRRLPPEAEARGPLGAFRRAELALWERHPDSLLALVQRSHRVGFETQIAYFPARLYEAWAWQLRGDRDRARPAFEAARLVLDSALRKLPDDSRIHAAIGLAQAGLGHRDDARREARWLQHSPVYQRDAYDGPRLAEARAMILAQAGDAEPALEELERLLAGPSGISVPILNLDPRWDPIRDDPRFQRLLAKYGPRGPQ